MPVRADDDQPAIADLEAGRVLGPVLVRLRLAGQLLTGEMMVVNGGWTAQLRRFRPFDGNGATNGYI